MKRNITLCKNYHGSVIRPGACDNRPDDGSCDSCNDWSPYDKCPRCGQNLK